MHRIVILVVTTMYTTENHGLVHDESWVVYTEKQKGTWLKLEYTLYFHFLIFFFFISDLYIVRDVISSTSSVLRSASRSPQLSTQHNSFINKFIYIFIYIFYLPTCHPGAELRWFWTILPSWLPSRCWTQIARSSFYCTSS